MTTERIQQGEERRRKGSGGGLEAVRSDNHNHQLPPPPQSKQRNKYKPQADLDEGVLICDKMGDGRCVTGEIRSGAGPKGKKGTGGTRETEKEEERGRRQEKQKADEKRGGGYNRSDEARMRGERRKS